MFSGSSLYKQCLLIVTLIADTAMLHTKLECRATKEEGESVYKGEIEGVNLVSLRSC